VPRYRHAECAQSRQQAIARAFARRLQRQAHRGGARSSQPHHFPLRRVPDHLIAVAADAVLGRFQQAQAAVDGDGRIRRRTARPQDGDGRLRRQRMGGTGGAMHAKAAVRLAKLAPTGRAPACTSGRRKRASPSGQTGGGVGSLVGIGAPPRLPPGGALLLWAGAAGASVTAGMAAMKVRRRMGDVSPFGLLFYHDHHRIRLHLQRRMHVFWPRWGYRILVAAACQTHLTERGGSPYHPGGTRGSLNGRLDGKLRT